MGKEPQGILIVTLQADGNVEGTRRRVSKIEGVVGVEFNHLTRKLLIRYVGDHARLEEVQSELTKVLKGKRRHERSPPPHHLERKRRR